jgi:hypothetical protein
MFHLSLHHKKTYNYSHDWHEQLTGHVLNKRVVGRSATKPYYRTKLAKSVHAACMRSFGYSGEAEITAMRVCKDVEAWLENKEEVTIADIKRRAADALLRYNPRAAYEYLPTKEYAVKEDQYGFVRL